MPRPSAEDRAGAREIETFLSTVVDGAPPILQALVPELGRYLETEAPLCYGVAIGTEGCDIAFAHARNIGPDPEVAGQIGRMVRASPRFGLYDVASVERRQRNRVTVVPPYDEVAAGAADGPFFAAAEVAHESLETLGVLDDHELRVLVCEGARLLAWVGALQPEPFSARQQRRLRAIVPALRRRLLLEARLQAATMCTAALPAILDRLAGAAFVVTPSGRVEVANTAGRSRYDGAPHETLAAIRAALRSPGSSGFEVTRLGIDGAPRCYLLVERPPMRTPAARIGAAARRHGLTPREAEVLTQLVQGASNKAMALELGCAERTVEVHVAHLLDKIGAPSRSALVARFWMEG